MDITPQDTTTQQPISDDQELAKALAGVLPGTEAVAPAAVPAPTEEPMKFEETPVAAPAGATNPAADAPSDGSNASTDEDRTPATPASPAPSAPSGDLEGIKKDALNELRPLIDKVDLPAEEKFDTYLMLIRSTDDSSLVAPAHAAAQAIADEKRRAEALLEIVKEIDYLSRGSQPAV